MSPCLPSSGWSRRGWDAPIEAAHYPADEIQRQLDRIHQLAATTEMPGKSISFGTAGLDADHVALPSFTFSMNSLAGRDAAAPSAQCRGGHPRRQRRALPP